MKKILKWTIVGTFLAVIAVGGFGLWILFGSKTSNPNNYKTIGEIPEPWGYVRINGDDVAYTNYLRSLPLKERGAKVQLYTGGNARFQSLNYAVINMPILSNAEQCADVCMRLRAEYLFNTGQYGRIRFQNVNGKTLSYGGGGSRKSFERYLRNLYGVASTFSLSREMKTRSQVMCLSILPVMDSNTAMLSWWLTWQLTAMARKLFFWQKETRLQGRFM